MTGTRNKTTSSKRVVSEGLISWSRFEKSGDATDEVALQMNLKNQETGDHIFYEVKTQKSGMAGGNRDK